MEQFVIFLMGHANEISLIVYGVTLILLLVTLHRIKQIKKQIQELAEKRGQAAVKQTGTGQMSGLVPGQATHIAETGQNDFPAGAETGQNDFPAGAEAEQKLLPAEAGQKFFAAEPEQAETPEKLLDAVLGEVFP